MNTDLNTVVVSLAELYDGELHALINATHNVPETAAGLLAWIEHACDWELNRRAGVDFPLQPPDAAIPPEEDAVSIETAMTMHEDFAQDDSLDTRATVRLFE